MLKHYLFKSLGLLGIFAASSLFGQNQTVTSPLDGLGTDLRTAVQNVGVGDTIFFSPALNGVTQTLTNGEILIDKSLVISGNDSTQTLLSTANTARVFRIMGAGDVSIEGINISAAADSVGGAIWSSNTNVSIRDASFTGNAADSSGGAIFFEGAGSLLQITNASFTANEAGANAAIKGGGAILLSGAEAIIQNSFFGANTALGTSGSGGAILLSSGAEAFINGSTFSGNSSSRAGGAIEDNSGASTTQSLSANTFLNNSTGAAPGNGGAIHITGPGNMTLSGDSLANNTAAREGGALWNGSGTMTVSNLKFFANIASGPSANDGGGAVFNNGGTLNISNSFFLENVADGAAGSGGAIFNETNGSLTLSNSEFYKNTAVRAGGAIEDNSGASTTMMIMGITADTNRTEASPGNGGAIHITGAGNAVISGSTFRANYASAEGGALWNGAGTMTVSQTTISDNEAEGAGADQGGGGIYNLSGSLVIKSNTVISNNRATGAAGSGGGILNDVGASLNITDAVFTANESMRAGGAIEDVSGDASAVIITRGEFYNNITGSSPGNGGAIHITGNGDMTILSSTFDGNIAAAEGGALWNGNGIMNVRACTITNNQANGAGADQGGGGIYILGGGVDIRQNTIISGNTALGASGSGGGILVDQGAQLAVANSIISKNESSRAGGGIEDNSRTATVIFLDQVTLDSNRTASAPGNGGGLHITGPGNVTLNGGVVSNNFASAEGGGLWNGAGVMVVNGTTISNNVADGALANQGGGGIYNLSGSVTVRDARIESNMATGAAGSGGGILNDSLAALTVENTVIFKNSAKRAGGGIEDVSYASTTVVLTDVTLDSNSVASAPGNGGGVHITGNGDMIVTGGVVSNNFASAEGGGLWNDAGTMFIRDVMFTGNVASGAGADQGGGALYNLRGSMAIRLSTFEDNLANGAAGSGGAILNDAGASLDVDSCDFARNISSRAGGAIEDNSGSLTTVEVANSTFNDNETGNAPGNGGAIHITGPGPMNISSSTFEGNIAAREGGAIWNGSGLMVITEIQAIGNVANGQDEHDGGGAVFNNGGILRLNNSTLALNSAANVLGTGGGLHNNGGEVDIILSTISGNTTSNYGAALYNNGQMTLTSTTVTNNTSVNTGGGIAQTDANSSVQIRNSIVADNTAVNANPDIEITGGTIVSGGYNLVGIDANTSITAAAGDSIGTSSMPVDPVLNGLTDNGGPTFTHLPACGSPALETGDPALTGNDQRGEAIFNNRDKGSTELQDDCDPSSINDFDETIATVYPNPLTGSVLNVSLESEAEYQLLELGSGKLLAKGKLSAGDNQIRVNNSGALILQVITNDRVEVHKILK